MTETLAIHGRLPCTVQLRPDAGGSDGLELLGVWEGERRLGTLLVHPTTEEAVLRLTVTVPLICTLERCFDLLEVAVAHARSSGASELEMTTADPLLRHAGWQSGFERRLRRPLRCRTEGRDRPCRPAPEAAGSRRPADPAEQAQILTALAGADVSVAPSRGVLAKLARGAVAGFAGMTHLHVDAGDGRRPLSLAFPNRNDVLLEGVASALHIVLSVRRRFGSAVDHLRTVSFDHSSHGLKSGQHAGEAQPNASIISLNASDILAGVQDDERRQRPGLGPGRPDRLMLPAAFTSLERTAAHEMWHQIEATFEARRYRESIEFRRHLGAHFGVETLEHAIRGRGREAPPEWQAAQRRLVNEVSDYGGTLPGEATAEMFKDWWCPVGDSSSPAVRLFGELVEQYFRVSRT